MKKNAIAMFGVDEEISTWRDWRLGMEKTMKDMEMNEIEAVDGGMAAVGIASAGLALAVGSASFGAGWGMVGVGLAFAASPLTVVALGGLALYAGYQLATD